MVHVHDFIGFGMIHVILLIPPLFVEMFSSGRWCLQSRTHNYTPWCKRQGSQEEHSQYPRRPPPAALHCKPQDHQSHPARKKQAYYLFYWFQMENNFKNLGADASNVSLT